MVKGLFGTIAGKFVPQYNKIIPSSEDCKLTNICDETAEDQVGRLMVKATECKYKDNDGRLKEQFINNIND